MLYFIIYPRVMAFNVEENAVFITEFSKNVPTVAPPPSPRSLALPPAPPPPIENPWLLQWMHSFKSHHDLCSYRIRRAIDGRDRGGGGGGHERPPFFSASQNSLTKVKSCGVPRHARDVRWWILGGGGGQTYRFDPPPPPNNSYNLKN